MPPVQNMAIGRLRSPESARSTKPGNSPKLRVPGSIAPLKLPACTSKLLRVSITSTFGVEISAFQSSGAT